MRELSIAGIYSDAYLVGNWLMSSTVLDEIVSGEQNDFFVAMKTADGVSEDEARQAIETPWSTTRRRRSRPPTSSRTRRPSRSTSCS